MVEVLAAVLLTSLPFAVALWYYQKRLQKTEDRLRALLARPVADPGGSRAVIKGQVAEQLAPLLPGFPYVPSDFRFLGQPIDFVVFRGLTSAKDGGEAEIEEVVLGDIKMGNATLSKHQRAIKRAVQQGRVRWETIHVARDFHIEEAR